MTVSSKLGTYYPDDVTLVACGILVSGFVDGTFVTAARNEESFSYRGGSDGEGCRARKNNRSGRITFTLLQSSQSNQELSALLALDEISPGGDGVLPSTLKDNSGTTLVAGEKSWIVKFSDVEYGDEVAAREWIIETNVLAMNVGGN